MRPQRVKAVARSNILARPHPQPTAGHEREIVHSTLSIRPEAAAWLRRQAGTSGSAPPGGGPGPAAGGGADAGAGPCAAGAVGAAVGAAVGDHGQWRTYRQVYGAAVDGGVLDAWVAEGAAGGGSPAEAALRAYAARLVRCLEGWPVPTYPPMVRARVSGSRV
jgi:hypothetical protein